MMFSGASLLRICIIDCAGALHVSKAGNVVAASCTNGASTRRTHSTGRRSTAWP